MSIPYSTVQRNRNVAQSGGDNIHSGLQYGMPYMVNLKNNPVTSIVERFSYINKNNGVNPMTNDLFLTTEIILPKTFPAKNFGEKGFGSLGADHGSGTSKFGNNLAYWVVYDRSFTRMPRNANTISYIRADKPYDGLWRIRAMHNNDTRISINFYNYELYKTMHNRIFP